MHNVSELAVEIPLLVEAATKAAARVAAVVAQRDAAVAEVADLKQQLADAKAAGTIPDDLFAALDGSVTALDGILAPNAAGTDPLPATVTDPQTPAGETAVPTA